MRFPLIALPAAVVCIAYADQIRLKDGRVLKGKVVYEDEGKVVLKAEYGKVTIYKDNIEKIVREEEAAPSPQKKRPKTVEEFVRAFAAGDDSALAKLKKTEDAVWMAKRLLKEEKEQARKVRLEALIHDLTRADPEDMEAAEKLRRAYEAGEHSRTTIYSLAAALAGTKSERDAREAEKLLRQILKDDPAYVPAVYELVRMLLKQKRKGEARDVVRRALSSVEKGSQAGKLLKRLLAELKK